MKAKRHHNLLLILLWRHLFLGNQVFDSSYEPEKNEWKKKEMNVERLVSPNCREEIPPQA